MRFVLSMTFVALLPAVACAEGSGVDAAPYAEIVIRGEDAPNGVYDPSLEYAPDGTGWMAYSAVTAGPDGTVETRIARSDDRGLSWTLAARINDASPAAASMPDGRMIAGRWWHGGAGPRSRPGGSGA